MIKSCSHTEKDKWGDVYFDKITKQVVNVTTCPYREDVHNDSKTLCACCAECKKACIEDI